jgi:CIC family chloride channel protein
MFGRVVAPRRLYFRILIGLRRILGNDQFLLAGLAILLGSAAAGAAIGFREAIAAVQTLFYGFGSERVASAAAALPWWQLIAAPTAGGLLVGLFLRYVMPGGRPQGVPHVMEACALKGGRMSLRTGLSAAAVSAASLGVGASTGREGPVVHLGAMLGGQLGQRMKLSRNLSRTLLGCGVAAAVAASFNAPIAGVFFALEVVIGHYALNTFAPIVMASVTGTVISRLYYGDFPAFILPRSLEIVSFFEFPAFALLGLVCAGIAMLFMAAVIGAETAVDRLKLPIVARPALAGLFVGLLALEAPEIIGVGYEATDWALGGELAFGTLVALLFAKIAATSLCLGCNFGGGVFSPSLFIGAMAGGAFGILATAAFPELSSGHGAYTLVGMGAVAGAVLGAPMSTILIVFEMTGNFAIAIAVMVAVVISSVLTQIVLGESLFSWQLARNGVSLKAGREMGLLQQIRVRDVMKADHVALRPDAGFDTVIQALHGARFGEVFLVDEDGRLTGVVTLLDVMPDDETDRSALVAADLARPDPPVLEAGDTLDTAMELMDQAGESHIAVVDRGEARRLVGFVHEHDVMLAYHRAILRARAEERGEPEPAIMARRLGRGRHRRG